MNNEHTFTELDDFAEIPASFVIENITETENSEIADEIEISYSAIEEQKTIIKEFESKESTDFE